MSLDYEYATVDVDLLVHPKAIAAGVEAMGLWLWGMVWSHKMGANGRLPKHVVLTAWGGGRSTLLKLSRALVACGLWQETDSGEWLIWNYGKKNQSAEEKNRRREQGRERMRRMRTRKSDAGCDASGDASQVRNVIDRGPAPDLISSGSGSLPADQEIPPARTEPGESMPDWFAVACDAAAMAVGGEVADRPARWVEYSAARHRKGWAMGHGDAVGWLSTVVRSERAKARAAPTGNRHVQSGENRAWIVPKDMP